MSPSPCREYQDAPGESAEGVAPGELTPQQQHQQYLGERRPELPTFPEIHWDTTPVPGKKYSVGFLKLCSNLFIIICCVLFFYMHLIKVLCLVA